MLVITIRYSVWPLCEAVTYRCASVRDALDSFYSVYGSITPGDEIIIALSCDE